MVAVMRREEPLEGRRWWNPHACISSFSIYNKEDIIKKFFLM